MSFVVLPPLSFNDAYAQPSDGYLGRRLLVTFDSTNIYTRTSDGYFSDITTIPIIPVDVVVSGTTAEGPTTETFVFNLSGENVAGILHFTSFTGVNVVSLNKIVIADSYGSVEVKELLPINYYDDGYNTSLAKFTAYGNGIFIYDAKNIDGYAIDFGYGKYDFEYAAPFSINLHNAPETIYIGNTKELVHAADGIMDEIKITSAVATKSRTRILAGSYDVSVEATSPVFSEPDAKTLVLLHLNDNTQYIIDAIRDPLDAARLSDSTLATIVSLRHDRENFLNYVNSLNITGTIVDGSIDTRSLSEQLYDLITVLDNIINSANYYNLAGKFLPSEITVNNNFKYAAIFSGENYFIEKPKLVNNTAGTIELWIAPLSDLYGDLTRKIYLDSINHVIIGTDNKLISTTNITIKLPNNIMAQYINSIHLAGIAGINNTDNFSEECVLVSNGNVIVLNRPLPMNNVAVIVDYIPFSTSNDRFTLYKDNDNTLVFAMLANGVLYQTSRDISNWKKNEWHRIMLTWLTNNKNNLDHITMYVDGTEAEIIKYGEGFLFNTFVFKQEHQIDINAKILPQNIQFIGALDQLNIGTDFLKSQPGMCRMANLRVSFIERQPLIDARGFKIDSDFDGGSKSATPEIKDNFTNYLEDFNPQNGFVTNFAAIQDPTAGIHDLQIIIRDFFNLVRGVNDGQVERLLKELLKIIKPAEARTRITITTNN